MKCYVQTEMITDLVENKLFSVTKSDTKMSKSSNLLVEKKFLWNEIMSYMQKKVKVVPHKIY